jgi:hypothetical protein
LRTGRRASTDREDSFILTDGLESRAMSRCARWVGVKKQVGGEGMGWVDEVSCQ